VPSKKNKNKKKKKIKSLILVVKCYVLVNGSFISLSATPSLHKHTYNTILTETVKLNPRTNLFNHHPSDMSFVGCA